MIMIIMIIIIIIIRTIIMIIILIIIMIMIIIMSDALDPTVCETVAGCTRGTAGKGPVGASESRPP